MSLLSQPLSPASAPASGITVPDAGTQTATAVAEEDVSEELESEEGESEEGPMTPEALRAILGPRLRGTLWEAYRAYQRAHPSRDYVLTYWEALAFAANRDPGVPPDREPTGAELRTIDEFIRRHPEFRYEKDF